MQFSPSGLGLLKKSEGFRSHEYKDAAGLPTIGYGHKCQSAGSFSEGIDLHTGETMLARDVDDAEDAVIRLVKVPLTQGQFDALVDFVFNLGAGRLAGSTLLKDLNAGHYGPAGEQLLLWDHAGGVELAALKERRRAEFNLWNTGVPS
jgi:lysozyme